MAVTVHLKVHHLDVTDDIRHYVERKLGRLDRFLPSLSELTLELTHQAHGRNAATRFIAEATAPARGAILRAEERAASPQAAIDAVADTLERQIERFKSKLYANLGRYEGWRDRLKSSVDETLAAPERAPEQVEGTPSELVRVKRFRVKPMLEEEAIEQMELLGHTFFVFLNGRTQRVNVVYRRADGGYGLLVPEVG